MRRITQIILVIVGSIVFTLGACEIAVRIAGIEPNSNPRLRFDPALGWTLDPTWGLDQVDPDGFRHLSQVGANGGRRRLVILGDSFAVGGQLPFRETFAGLLTDWLDRDGGPDDAWEVLNLAASLLCPSIRQR